MRELWNRFTEGGDSTRDPEAFSSGSAVGEQPILTSVTFSERLREQHDLMDAADEASGRPHSFISTYNIVSDGAGGQKLEKDAPLGGVQAGYQGYMPCPQPENPTLGGRKSTPPPDSDPGSGK